jgi:hypothetical protein
MFLPQLCYNHWNYFTILRIFLIGLEFKLKLYVHQNYFEKENLYFHFKYLKTSKNHRHLYFQ